MSRLAATLGIDVRVQLRNGLYAATALIVVFSILLLRFLLQDMATLLFPVVILENVLVNTIYFVSELLLLERVEGTFTAQAVTPLRDHEYLASKLGTLAALSLGESLLITAAVFGVDGRLLAVAIGVTLAGVLFCLAGIALVLRYASINEFLLPSVLYAFLLTLPILGALGVGPLAWYLPHPLQGPLTLMRIDAAHTAGQLAYAKNIELRAIFAVM